MSTAKYFSTINLKNAYLQIPLDEESSSLTTINTPFGLYRYLFLPFGLSASPAIFLKVMDDIISGISGVVANQDDIIVYGESEQEHKKRVADLLQRLAEMNVKINSSRCVFSSPYVNCLGYTLDGTGVWPDGNRLDPSPQNYQELQSVLSSIQYHSRCIPNFAAKADVLFKLQAEDTFLLSIHHEKCLRELLEVLKTEAVIRPFSMIFQPTVITDRLLTKKVLKLSQFTEQLKGCTNFYSTSNSRL